MSTHGAAAAVRRTDASVPRALPWVAAGGVGYFVAAIALLHVLRPDVDPIARVTSEYAIGPYGLIMTSSYFVFGIALAALALSLARSLDTAVRSAPGIMLLLLAALATATAALFPVDVGAPRPVTPQGWAHRMAAIVAFASMALGPLALVRRFRGHPVWRDLAWTGVIVGAVGAPALVAIQAVLLERGLAGAAQRVVLALVIAWMLTVVLRLIVSGPRPEPVDPR